MAGDTDAGKASWLSVLNTFGFPTLAAMAVAWFCYQCVIYEREKMQPTIEHNTQVIEANTQTQQHVKESLDRLDYATRQRTEQVRQSQQ